mmetsp:Transcript_26395/g.72890  ORF Transcript_26395/g.72890 Transcript_26395/m.72890 type:complete len:236 (-) Transcript_26395:189-896(-)
MDSHSISDASPKLSWGSTRPKKPSFPTMAKRSLFLLKQTSVTGAPASITVATVQTGAVAIICTFPLSAPHASIRLPLEKAMQLMGLKNSIRHKTVQPIVDCKATVPSSHATAKKAEGRDLLPREKETTFAVPDSFCTSPAGRALATGSFFTPSSKSLKLSSFKIQSPRLEKYELAAEVSSPMEDPVPTLWDDKPAFRINTFLSSPPMAKKRWGTLEMRFCCPQTTEQILARRRIS